MLDFCTCESYLKTRCQTSARFPLRSAFMFHIFFCHFKPTFSKKLHIRWFDCVQIYVERVSGCPHMECRMCKSEFCYFCGERWTEIHQTVCSRSGTKDLRPRLQKFRLRFRRLGKKLKTTGIVGKRRLLHSLSPTICISSFVCICCVKGTYRRRRYIR